MSWETAAANCIVTFIVRLHTALSACAIVVPFMLLSTCQLLPFVSVTLLIVVLAPGIARTAKFPLQGASIVYDAVLLLKSFCWIRTTRIPAWIGLPEFVGFNANARVFQPMVPVNEWVGLMAPGEFCTCHCAYWPS
jgi:hypothetical protein